MGTQIVIVFTCWRNYERAALGSKQSRRAADQATWRLTESANVPRILSLAEKPRNVSFALVGLSAGCSIHQQHTKKKDQIEHRKYEQATSRPPFLVIAPT